MDRRIKLRKGMQKEIINKAAKTNRSLKELAKKVEISYSLIRKYNQEKLLMPENLFNKLLNITSVNKKKIKIEYLQQNWGKRLGGLKGMETLKKKYPDKISLWRKNGLKNSNFSNLKKIKFPEIDEKLAEFVGVYLGDGTLTKYFIRISGDSRFDNHYFKYLSNLIREIFEIDSKITKEKNHNTIYLTIYSKEVCLFFEKNLGIKLGDKIRNNTLIPKIFLENNILSLALLRGLMDTDGSISRRGRKGEQFTVVLTSHNPNLIEQVKSISDKNNLFSFISKKRDQIGTNSKKRIVNYFKIVGSSNLRHIIRFKLRFEENKTIYQKDISDHLQKDLYRDINLPFKSQGLVV